MSNEISLSKNAGDKDVNVIIYDDNMRVSAKVDSELFADEFHQLMKTTFDFDSMVKEYVTESLEEYYDSHEEVTESEVIAFKHLLERFL